MCVLPRVAPPFSLGVVCDPMIRLVGVRKRRSLAVRRRTKREVSSNFFGGTGGGGADFRACFCILGGSAGGGVRQLVDIEIMTTVVTRDKNSIDVFRLILNNALL